MCATINGPKLSLWGTFCSANQDQGLYTAQPIKLWKPFGSNEVSFSHDKCPVRLPLLVCSMLKHIRNLLLVRGFIFVLIESYFVLPKNLLKYLVTTLWHAVPPNHLTNKIYSIVYTYCVMIYINIQLKFSWKLTFFFSGRYFTVCEHSRLTSAASWVPPPY